MTEKGVSFIKRFEKFEPVGYLDIAGVPTNGWGHTGADVEPGVRIDKALAEENLRKDLIPVERAIARFFGGHLADWEADAVGSWLFNVGTGALDPHFAPRTCRRANMALIAITNMAREVSWRRRAALLPLAEAIHMWNKATIGGILQEVAGLTRRRNEEAELLLFGDYEWGDEGIVAAPGM